MEIGVSGWWGRVESHFTERSLAIDLWVVFGVPWILRELNLNLEFQDKMVLLRGTFYSVLGIS